MNVAVPIDTSLFRVEFIDEGIPNGHPHSLLPFKIILGVL